MTFKLHPEARTEYREAIIFYGKAAEKFNNAVESAIAEIIRRPERFRELEPGVRICRVSKFPYYFTCLKSKRYRPSDQTRSTKSRLLAWQALGHAWSRPHGSVRLHFMTDADAGGFSACRRRQKKYESAQSTRVPAGQPHACGPSPTERCAISAEARLTAKPA